MDTLTDPYTDHVPSCIFLHNLSHAQMHANPELPAHIYKTSTNLYTVADDASNRTRKEKHERVCRKKVEMLARRVWTRESVAGLVFLDLSPCVLPRRCLSFVEEFLTGKKQKARSQKRGKKRLRGWEKKRRGKKQSSGQTEPYGRVWGWLWSWPSAWLMLRFSFPRQGCDIMFH